MGKSHDLVNVRYIAFNKITRLWIKKIKNLNQLRTETLRVNISFNGESLKALPIKSGRILWGTN